MGIYIPNMGMPKERSLWLCIKTDGTVYNIKPGGIGTAHAVGTAAPLPEGHGRLIDADAMVSKYTDGINQLEEWAKNHEKDGRPDMFRYCHLRSAYLAEAKLNVEAAPTIVPAEGGTEDG